MQYRKNKYRWLRWPLLIMLLIVSLAMIFNKQLKNLTIQHISNSAYHASLKDPQKSKGSFDFKKVKSLDVTTVAKAMTYDSNAIARLAIPSVSMRLPVFYGLDNNNLARGAGTMKPNQVLGKGNYALAGHYMTNAGNLFSPLKRIQTSAYVYLTDNQQVYTYQVTNKQTIDDHQVSVIDDVPGKKLLTLVTCDSATPNTPKRFIVQADLIKKAAATQSTLHVFN
ncbi:class A sortase [Lactobacillus paracasei subsp. tolerans]|uniref:class A sortase n=1 Tax=Lacticaseibacillus paracasei TaxID=1597 RepID=UPI00188ABF5D|nr:class A sortase [Lacticaseibacillus paracasei]MBF4176060.1 class A sortase [Lacticaseibacillus paracasei subsp. tolerans]